jgi:hypothetical protein
VRIETLDVVEVGAFVDGRKLRVALNDISHYRGGKNNTKK